MGYYDKNSDTEYPRIVEVDKYLKFIRKIKKIDKVGYMEVKITAETILKEIKIPEYLWKLKNEMDMELPQIINMILRDFVIRHKEGVSKYEEGILKRIDNFANELDEEQRKRLYSILFKE